MLSVTLQTWIEEREELRKEVSSAHVGLNMTEIKSERDRGEPGKEASSTHVGLNVIAIKTEKTVAGTWSQSVGKIKSASKESSRRK